MVSGGRYTLEFKLEAVRLVESSQAAACSLGVVEQTLGNWVKLHLPRKLRTAGIVLAGITIAAQRGRDTESAEEPIAHTSDLHRLGANGIFVCR